MVFLFESCDRGTPVVEVMLIESLVGDEIVDEM